MYWYSSRLPSHIWKIEGKMQNGPNVVILGGTHGDELPGLKVVRMMLAATSLLHSAKNTVVRDDVWGNIFIGFGNPEAILRCARAASELRDLNRCFVPEELNAEPNSTESMDLLRARKLAPLFRKTDVLLDLHSTSGPSEPFLCTSAATEQHLQMAPLFPVKYFLTDPNHILPGHFHLPVTGTTDYFVNNFGGSPWSVQHWGKRKGVALCYESGQEEDIGKAEEVLNTVLSVLAHLKVISSKFPLQPRGSKHSQPKLFALVEAIIAREDVFTYAPGMEVNWQIVTTGQLVGTYNTGEREECPRSGMSVFPTATQKIKKGKKLYYVAEEVRI